MEFVMQLLWFVLKVLQMFLPLFAFCAAAFAVFAWLNSETIPAQVKQVRDSYRGMPDSMVDRDFAGSLAGSILSSRQNQREALRWLAAALLLALLMLVPPIPLPF